MKAINKSECLSVDSPITGEPEYGAYCQALSNELDLNPISDDFQDYLVLMAMAHCIEYSTRAKSAQEMALPVLKGMVKRYEEQRNDDN